MESYERPMRIVEGTAGERPNEAAPAFQLDAVRSVRMHPKLAAFVACVVMLLVAGYALTRKPMYEARSLSYVEPLETKVVSDGSQGIYDPARYDSYFQQQIQTATRQDILEAAIKKLPAGMWQLPDEDLHSAAERLGNALKVERVGSSYQLAISMQSENPEKASAIVNAATNAYLEQGRKDENARSDGRLVLLQEENQRIQKELQQDRDEQASLSQTLGVADPQNGGTNPYDAQLTGVRTELVAAREAHDVAAAQLASVTGRGGSSAAGLKAIADEAIASDTGLGALKTTINERRAVLNTQMATLTPTNPLYKQDADEIAAMDKQVDARMTQLRQTAEHRVEDKLRLDLQRTGDVEARLNSQLAHATSLAGSAAPKLQRAKDLAADITRLQARFATVDDALRGLQLESNGPGTAHLLVAAQVPDAPAANRRNLLLALALPLGMFAGIVAAVLARKRDQRLYSAMDLEQVVGVTPMSVMPASYGFSDAALDEHLLRLAAGLERGHRLNGARMFVFTAASESMETSGLVCNVQAKLKELGFEAVVLDAANLRQTTAEERRLGKASSQIEQMKRDNAFLLIDARPLLSSADAEYAASCADATLVVAESGVTTGTELKQCMLLLQQLKATGVGTILQKATDAGDAIAVRNTIVPQRQKTPEWQVTRGFVPKVSAPEPVKMAEEKPIVKVKPVVREEELPKRVQLVPPAAPIAKAAAPVYREEPFMLFEEAATGAPVVQKAVLEPKLVVREEFVEQAKPVIPQYVERPVVPHNVEPTAAVKKIEEPIGQKAEQLMNESVEEKAERIKREAVARVRARYGMPAEVIEALAVAMQKPKAEPAFAPIAAAPAIQDPPEETRFVWQTAAEPVREAITQRQSEPVAAAPAAKPLPAAAFSDLPPVRRVTVPQEKSQTKSMPVAQWSMQPERRRVPRDPIVFPRGLNKAALRMQEKGQAIAKGQAGPSLTAAEQAIANKVSSAHHPVAAKPEARRGMNAESAARWNLLRRFGAFEIEEQNGPSLEERAAG